MKWIPIILLIFAHLSCRVAIQPSSLHFQGYMQELCVTPDEQFVICTQAGEVAMADSINGLWHFSQIAPSFSGTLENINFFNRDTGFVSGAIDDGAGNDNIIYHTKNGGKSWSKVKFSTTGWADAAYNLPNGETWMTVGGEGIAYSKDYGLTWKNLTLYDVKQRYQTIFFNQQHEGVIGSIWNTIAYTKDNCNTWRKIPTPLDQHAYNKTAKQNRPSINKVCIYKNLLLVNQEDMIFYTNKDTINWKSLPDYTSFSTDAANTALYLINSSQQVVKTDERLRPLQTSAAFEYLNDIYTRNGQLFLLSFGDTYKIDANGKVHQYRQQTMTKEPEKDKEPTEIYSTKTDIIYGAKGNKIYTKIKEKWKYAFTLPFTVITSSDISINNDTLVYTTGDSLYYYDIAKHRKTVTTIKDLLNDFLQHKVTTVTFSEGSQGCFYSYADKMVYKLENNHFVLADSTSPGEDHTPHLKPEKDTFSQEKVEQFVKEVCQKYNRRPVIKDIGFSEADYQKCKADIKAYQHAADGTETDFYFPRNNINFDQLIATVDSVRTIDSVTLNKALLNINQMFSTTSNWINVTLENEDGKQLMITNTYDKPNALYIPWSITINGGGAKSVSPVITEFLQYACPSLVQEQNKVPILHRLVMNLYK